MLSQSTITILRCFKKRANRAEVVKITGFNSVKVSGTVSRLMSTNLIRKVETADCIPGTWLIITTEGEQMLRMSPYLEDTEQDTTDKATKPKTVPPVQPESDWRNIMKSSVYTPPNQEPPRANSLAYKQIPSRGIG